MTMGDVVVDRTRHGRSAFVPRPAPTCQCAARELVVSRDEDGDWSCCGCGRLVGTSATSMRAVRAAVLERMAHLG
jgi:ribosomal protein L37AE/L43A